MRLPLVVALSLPPAPGSRVYWPRERPIDFENLLMESVRARTFPAVFNNLRSLSSGLRPGSDWEERFRRSHAVNLALKLEETRLVDRVNQAGVCCRAIKGVRLVELLYPDLSWRAVADIDLIVPRREVGPAYEVLKAMGLQDANEPWSQEGLARQIGQPGHAFPELKLYSRYGTLIELHWDWTGESFPAGNPDEDREAFLVYLCQHAGKHFWSSLRMVCDVELFLRRFAGQIDYARFWKLAKAAGWERSCSASLELCSMFFGRSAQGWGSLRSGRALAGHAANVLIGGVKPWWWRSRPLRLLRMFNWKQRVTRCWAWLVPAPWHWNHPPGSPISDASVWVTRYLRVGFRILARIAPSKRWKDRVQKAAGLTGAEWLFLIRAYLTLLAVRLTLTKVPFDRLMRWATRPARKAKSSQAQTRDAILRAAWLVEVAANHHFIPIMCLPRSLALVWLLAHRGVETELKMGVRSENKSLRAHAWVEWQGERLNDPHQCALQYSELRPVPSRD